MSAKQIKTVRKAALCMGIMGLALALVFGPSLMADTTVPAAAGTEKEETAQAVPVKTADVENQTLQAYLEVNGNIVNSHAVEVFPDMTGKLVSIKVALGQRVTKGQVIAEVDSSMPGLNYLPGAVRSPISGTVGAVHFAEGSIVSPASSIALIAANDRLEIEARIPEREVSRLRAGLTAAVFLEAYPGKTFAATVREVAPAIDPQSRTKKIVLMFDNTGSGPEAGMFVRLRLNTRVYPDVVTVPGEAILQRDNETFVYVLDWNDRVNRRLVKTGVTIDGVTEITAGLAGGEAVVVQGQQFLSDGVTVRVSGADGRS
ncbi:efflux RND transporter periplasmic adaptor subunit [Treponema primitia]|uniref:efflux RND transporter periplasmic adaptor subunit n=1 Tax=Treponema primitia TaxID=88058 RepID=UPI003980F6A1